MSTKLLYTVSGTRLILTVSIQNLTELQLYGLLLKHVNQTDGLTEGVDGPFRFLFDQADMHKIFCITKSNLSKSYSYERSNEDKVVPLQAR
jgi:hypothetical protein